MIFLDKYEWLHKDSRIVTLSLPVGVRYTPVCVDHQNQIYRQN